VTALEHPRPENEDFNISADECAFLEIAQVVWQACARDPAELGVIHRPGFIMGVQRRPSVDKARQLLSWEAPFGIAEGITATAGWLERQSAGRGR
jgi:UDP-glucose 4-epimerase